ncbi:hypothetical protein CLOBAR_00690 [Intestinibacter bartlettii DSM 16795]|nr:hypothetical protein CLOBAR_00690 [Intestinibacter bartlettii DSM 16795]
MFELCKKCAKNKLEHIKIIIFIINNFLKYIFIKKKLSICNV